MVGQVLSEKDLHRAKAKSASRIFLFSTATGSSATASKTDHRAITRVMALKHSCPGVPICVQVCTPEAAEIVLELPNWSADGGDVCVCLESLKLSLMAINSILPGAATMFTNLLSSSADDSEVDKRDRDQAASGMPWATEYEYGRESSLCQVQLPSNLVGREFQLCVLHLYAEYGCTLFALETKDPRSCDKSAVITIHPADYLIAEADVGFLICPSKPHLKENEGIGSAACPEDIAQDIWSDNRPIKVSGSGSSNFFSGSPMKAAASRPHFSDFKDSLLSPGSSARADKVEEEKQAVAIAKREVRLQINASVTRRAKLLDLWAVSYARNTSHMLHDAQWCRETGVAAPGTVSQEAAPAEAWKPDEGARRLLLIGFNPYLKQLLQTMLDDGIWVDVLMDMSLSAAEKVRLNHPHVRYNFGSPLQVAALQGAGIEEADTVVILASHQAKPASQVPEFMPDTHALMVFELVKRVKPSAFVMVELEDSDATKFIDWGSSGKSTFPYATGQIFSSLVPNLLMSKVHKIPSILMLFHSLLNGTVEESSHDGSRNAVRVLQQVPVPVELSGSSYKQLFQHMVRNEGSIPLGIFGKRGNSERIVVTNPPPTLEVQANDLLYVVDVSPGMMACMLDEADNATGA